MNYLCVKTANVSPMTKFATWLDDCGDSSDESACINHFKCQRSGEYLPVNQKYDGTIHCSDISDECNDSCGQEIVNSTSLTLVALEC